MKLLINIFAEIADRIKTQANIIYIDAYAQQDKYAAPFQLTIFPAVFIDNMKYIVKNTNGNSISGELHIAIYVMFESLLDNTIIQTDGAKRLKKEMPITQNILKALHNWQPESANSELIFKSFDKELNEDAQTVYIMEFVCGAIIC